MEPIAMPEMSTIFLFMYKVFMGLCSIILLIGANMWRKLNSRVDEHDSKFVEHNERLYRHEADHFNFKIEAEKRYAKEETMQTSLGRLHDRIDGIGTDIKTILVRLPK